MDANALNINLADPESIKERLPEVEQIADAKRQEAEGWEALANDLARIAGVKRDKAPARKVFVSHKAKPKPKRERPPSTRDYVVKVVNQANKPVGVGDVLAELTEWLHSPPKRDTVAWSLWKAVQEDQLQSVAKGVYAPVEYEADQNDLLASRNGSEGAKEVEA